ncbi:MAG: rhomboid family intramembrane serine protease [Porticoccaceae bacterium]|nr:rhomboid family intramembrane serine protease [Porticoccaceae bacterium]
MSVDENSWTLVAQFALDWSPDKLVAELQRRGINHRLVVDEQRQSLWVELPEHIVEVDQLVRCAREPERSAAQDPWSYGAAQPGKTRAGGGKGLTRVWLLFREFPVTMWGILLSFAGALLVSLSPVLANQLLFPFFEQWSMTTLWRWLTPIFLHFGISHVVFNCLWLWVFGSRLEKVCGSGRLLGIIVATGLGGNIAQYLWSQTINFGGMSGVVYGLMGYVWLRQQRNPHPLLAFPPMLFGMMFIFLILGMTGTLSQLFGTGIANAAHLGGLLAGMALALVSAPKPKR